MTPEEIEARKQALLARRAQLRGSTSLTPVSAGTPPPAAGSAVGGGETQGGESFSAGNVATGIAAGVVRAPAQALGGAFDFAQDVGQLAGEGLHSVDQRFLRGTLSAGARELVQAAEDSGVAPLYRNIFDADGDGRADFGDTLSRTGFSGRKERDFGKVGNDTVNETATEIGAVITAFGGLRSLAKEGLERFASTGVRRVAAESVVLGAGAAQVLDPEQERLANMAQSLGFEDSAGFIDFVAATEDDGIIENRLGLAIEEGVTGIAADGVFSTVRFIRAALKGDEAGMAAAEEAAQASLGRTEPPTPATVSVDTSPEAAVGEALDQDFAVVRAREAAAPPPPPEGQAADAVSPDAAAESTGSSPQLTAPPQGSDAPATPTGTSRGDTATPSLFQAEARQAGPETRNAVNQESLAKDLTAAAERLGIPEQYSADTLTIAGGRVVVSDAAAEAFNAAGVTRSVIGETAASRLPSAADTVAFRTTGADGASRVAATASRQTVESLAADIRARADGVVDPDGKDLAKDIGQDNSLLKFNDESGLQATMRGVLATLGDVARTRSDADLMRAARESADVLGTDTNTALAWGQQLAGETENLDIAVKTLETMWVRSTRAIDSIRVDDISVLSVDELKDVAQQIHNVMTFAAQQTRVKAGLGRALRTRQTVDADTYLATVGDSAAAAQAAAARATDASLPAIPFTRAEIEEWVSGFKATDGEPNMRSAFLDDQVRLPNPAAYAGNSLVNLFAGNILTAPYTFMMNLVAPAGVVAPLRTLEKAVGSLSSAAYAAASGDLDASARAFARATDTATGYRMATMEAGSMALNVARALLKQELPSDTLGAANARGVLDAARTGQSVLGSGNSVFDVSPDLMVPSALQAQRGVGTASKTAYAFGNAVNYLPRFYRQYNAALDEVANRISYTGEMAVRLLDQGREAGLSGRALHENVRQKLPDILDENFAASDAAALREAQRTTLTSAPGSPGGISERTVRAVNAARRDVPILRAIAPIFNVPANGVGETMRRIPGFNLLFRESYEELTGRRGARLQEEALGRMYAAGGFLVTGVAMAQQGLMTGSGPSDPRARMRWLEEGNQPYSIRFSQDEDWVDMSRYDIAGTLMGVTADLFDRSVYVDDADEQRNMALAAVGSFAEYIRDRAALQTIVDFASVTQDGPNNIGGLEGRIKQMAASTVVPNFVTALGRNTTDDIARNPRSFSEAIFNKLPGLSQQVPPRLNSLGEPVHIPRDTLIENVAPVLISPVNTWKEDAVMDELARIYEATGAYPGISQPRDLGKGEFDPRDVRLTDVEDGYDLFNEFLYQRSLATNDQGKTLRQSLTDLFASEEYAQGQDADASRTNLIDGGQSRTAMVSKVFREYTKLGKQQVSRNSDIAARWLAAARVKEGSSVAVEQFRVSEIVDDPNLLAELGVNFDDYIAEQKGE